MQNKKSLPHLAIPLNNTHSSINFEEYDMQNLINIETKNINGELIQQ
ncbi:hypothetical protein [Candidatus Arsenophonus triatominarum]|nr:hypothetical protein [Candidatus Arsenophonus triatominarum]